MLQFLWHRVTCNFNTCISKWVSTKVKPCNRPPSLSPHLQIQKNEVLTTHLQIFHCKKHECYTYKYNKFLNLILVQTLVHLLITALSSISLKTLGLSFPSCGNGVTLPISTKPNPAFNSPSTASPCLSKPAAKPMGLQK